MAAAAGIQAGAGILGAGLDFIRGQQQLGIQQRAIDQARRDADMQAYLTMRGMDLQQRMSTAGQRDVYGNRVLYDPNTNTWVTETSPQGQALINRSDLIQRQQDIRNLTTGQDERTLALQRRVAAGEGADALLRQFTNQYGAPTKEGVGGTARVAAATAATEPADIAKSGFTAAALRQGGSVPNLNVTLSSADRAQTSGLRTALAQDTSPLYQEMKANWQGNVLNPRSTLASESSAPDIPFSPSTIPSTLDTDLTNRSIRAPSTVWNPYTGYSLNAANKSLIDAMGNYNLPDYGTMGGALGKTIMGFGKNMGWWGNAFNDPEGTATYGSPRPAMRPSGGGWQGGGV